MRFGRWRERGARGGIPSFSGRGLGVSAVRAGRASVNEMAFNPFMEVVTRLKQRARRLKKETFALYLAARHPATPWYAKVFVAAIVAYALSPIDLIPDFIPVLGFLDEIVLLPLGLALAIRMIPAAVLEECRRRAHEMLRDGKPVSVAAAVVIVVIWVALVVLCGTWIYSVFLARGQ